MIRSRYKNKGAGVTKCGHLDKLMQNDASDVVLLIEGETTCEDGQLLLLGLYDADGMSGGDENEKYGV